MFTWRSQIKPGAFWKLSTSFCRDYKKGPNSPLTALAYDRQPPVEVPGRSRDWAEVWGFSPFFMTRQNEPFACDGLEQAANNSNIR